jgi:transposase InsO family protein
MTATRCSPRRGRFARSSAASIKCLKLPPQNPNLNAIAERFVLSIKTECLDKLVPLGERHLRSAISEFVEHYHLSAAAAQPVTIR